MRKDIKLADAIYSPYGMFDPNAPSIHELVCEIDIGEGIDHTVKSEWDGFRLVSLEIDPPPKPKGNLIPQKIVKELLKS